APLPTRHDHRRAHRHRCRRPRRPPGPGCTAHCRPARSVVDARRRCHGPRQPGRPAEPVAGCDRRLPPPRRSDRVEPHRDGSGARRVAHRPHADAAGRRPLPRAGFDHRGRAALPRNRQEAARAVAGRACGLQHQRGDAVGQCAWHAGGLPVRPGPATVDAPGRRFTGDHARRDPPDRHPLGGRGREAADQGIQPRRVRHALHRRGRHEARDGRSAGRHGRQHPPARELRRGLPRSADCAGRGHHDSRRAELPRGAAGDGDDCRHRPYGVAGHRRTQSGAGHEECDRPAGGGPGGKPVRQVDVDPGL
ncbi:MAG: Arginase, partial [uncultured Lysobacter sp.]